MKKMQVQSLSTWFKWRSSYGYNCLRTVLSGRVEYVIDGKRYVAEPGDEIAYPAGAKQTVTNLHDGDSVVLVATK